MIVIGIGVGAAAVALAQGVHKADGGETIPTRTGGIGGFDHWRQVLSSSMLVLYWRWQLDVVLEAQMWW